MSTHAFNSGVPAAARTNAHALVNAVQANQTRSSSLPARRNNATTTRSTGSVTQTITTTPTPRDSLSREPPSLFLRLRGGSEGPSTLGADADTDAAAPARTSSETRRGIRWADDVIDNEGLGRKSSKVCCIYHKPRGVDESSDEDSSDGDDSDSSSDDNSDSGNDDGAARPTAAGGAKRRGRACGHDGHDKHNHHKSGKARQPSPNAYERVPKPRP